VAPKKHTASLVAFGIPVKKILKFNSFKIPTLKSKFFKSEIVVEELVRLNAIKCFINVSGVC